MIGTYLVLLILLACISIALLYYSDHLDGIFEFLVCLVGFIGASASTVVAIVGLIFAYNWYAAFYQAQIINREYDTQYTQAEVFYASNVIDIVRTLDRNRIEVNGDLLCPRANP